MEVYDHEFYPVESVLEGKHRPGHFKGWHKWFIAYLRLSNLSMLSSVKKTINSWLLFGSCVKSSVCRLKLLECLPSEKKWSSHEL